MKLNVDTNVRDARVNIAQPLRVSCRGQVSDHLFLICHRKQGLSQQGWSAHPSLKKHPVPDRERVEDKAGDIGAVSNLSRVFENMSGELSFHSGSDSSFTTKEREEEGQAEDFVDASVETRVASSEASSRAATDTATFARASALSCALALAFVAASLPHFRNNHFWCSTMRQFQMTITSATDPHTMLPITGSPIFTCFSAFLCLM